VLAGALALPAPTAVGAASAHAPRHVPDVVGLTRADVFAAMRHAQLYFTTRGPGSTDGTWRSVTAQSPRAGVLVAWHATVKMTTSRAPGHALRRVPRVKGLTKRQVYAAMRHAQLYFTTRGPGSVARTWIAATGVSPRAGTLVRWHTTVEVATNLHRPAVKKVHPVTTTTRPRHPTTTRPVSTTTRPATTTTSPISTTTYPGETTTTGATTTTRATSTTVHRTTTTLKHKAVRYQIGWATWYPYFPGRCATSYLPFGTRIHVRDLANGRTIVCVVTDHEGHGEGRVVDLSATQFAELAPLARGVVRVKVSW
jgi:beta-lactam-binding protein with PASTA domain